MVHCKICGKVHKENHPHYKLVNKLTDKGFPTHDKGYKSAHKKANKLEKEKFGEKNFKKMERIDEKVGKHELVGKNLKSGTLEVARKVPTYLRREVAYHEKKENEILRKK